MKKKTKVILGILVLLVALIFTARYTGLLAIVSGEPTADIITDNTFPYDAGWSEYYKPNPICIQLPGWNVLTGINTQEDKLLDYRFVQHWTWDTVLTSPFKIFENEQLKAELHFTGDVWDFWEKYPIGTIVYEDNNIVVKSGDGAFNSGGWMICVKPDALKIIVEQKGWFLEGEEKPKKFIIKVDTNLKSDIERELYYGFYKRIGFAGEEQYALFKEHKSIIISPGHNEYEITIPQDIESGNYKFYTFIRSLPAARIGRYDDMFYYPLSDFVKRDFIVETQALWVTISPGEPCPPGYIKHAKSETQCILESYKDEPCWSIRCAPGWECTTGGCVEVLVGLDCKNDTNCRANEKCDLSIGKCMPKILYDSLYKCSTKTDCTPPCYGRDYGCKNGYCWYNLKQPCKEPIKKCYEEGGKCAEGSVCDEVSGRCIQTFWSSFKVWASENKGLLFVVSILLLGILGIFGYLVYEKWLR